MNRVKTLLAASVALALVFTVSCSSDKDDPAPPPGKPVCYYVNSVNGMCLEGGKELEKECKSMGSIYKYEASGACPAGEVEKCPNPNQPDQMMYLYGDGMKGMCAAQGQ